MRKILLLCLVMSIGLTGCGEVSNNGSTSVFKTGTITYSSAITSNPLEATVTATPNVVYTTADATVTVISTAFSSALTPSNFTVKNIRVSYKKDGVNTFYMSRPLADTPLKSGSSVSIPVILARADIKDELVDIHGFIPGNSTRWGFYANLDYDVIEDIGGLSKHYSVQLGTIYFL